jgi:RNA polymerase sigma factor (sigma-70 family)
MTDDAELLRRYALDRSEDAFRELVRRNLGLVYHAALRQCGDPHQAEDVAQAVFTDLARKAHRLSSRPVLAGWLHTSARYASLRVLRAEGRRRARELKAHAMGDLDQAGGTADSWERLRPVLDDALQALGERDREAVLLRFFGGRAFAEIGAALSLSEDAARMRVERALERMRAALGRRGVTSTAAALAAELAAHAAQAAPAGAAAKIAGAALGAGSPAALIAFMSMTKIQVGAAALAAALGAAGLVWQHHSNVRLRSEVAGLRQAAAENARLRAENQRLEKEAAGAAALAEAARPPSAAVTARPAQPAARPSVPLASGLIPVETLGNAGRSTPRAAFATQLWAARTGDVALEASLIALGPDARARLEALAQTLPADVRSEYDTPEKLMAFALAGSPHPVGGMQVMGEVASGPDDVTLQTQWQHVDDSVVHQSEAQMHQDADGWKLVVPIGLVNRAANYLGRTLGAQEAPSVPAQAR